jgi:DNA mismatch repair ATPase MutS
MEETAVICQQATSNSLVILDEVGRGTSTYDGLAIAQAVLEYLYRQVGCYCLFATHYHELTSLGAQLPGITNYHAASKQQEQGVLFLHKIVKGAAQGSFGIEVAQLAQLPPAVITRAREILSSRRPLDTTPGKAPLEANGPLSVHADPSIHSTSLRSFVEHSGCTEEAEIVSREGEKTTGQKRPI